ncbi:hypothetical protein HY483_01680 [Candidatus Woesearchaeota archaeon]|nr:hypothetical protein [Candidatus Woesearchaeota archaeon]
MGLKNTIQNVYEKEFKKLLIIPLLLFVLAVAQISFQVYSTGDFVDRSVGLKGGVSITASQGFLDVDKLSFDAKSFSPNADIAVRSLRNTGEVIVEISDISEDDIVKILDSQSVDRGSVVVEVTSSVVGGSFFRATMSALVLSFILMTIVVAISFRTFIPSLAVVLAAASDIVVTLAIFNITGQKLTTAGIAAFLMLIGYSVDTDILLSTRALKRKEGSFNDRIYSSIKTGLMTSFTTIIAVALALFIAKSETIQQIMLIILIGMFVDIVNTWIQNVGILRWYHERRGGVV